VTPVRPHELLGENRSGHDDLVRRLLTVIDLADWSALAELVTEDICYDRPGYPTIRGVRELLEFYRHTRIVGSGKHQLDQLLTDDTQGFCWGSFVGVSRSGQPIDEVFADWYAFAEHRISRRRSFFFRPAI